MENEMRKLIDQVKNFGKPLNENIFQCNVEELYKSVLEYVNTKLHYPKEAIKVEIKDNNYVLISYDYKINTDMSWNNLDDASKIKKLQLHKNNFEKMFFNFKDFCDKGIKGFVSTFKKDVTIINIDSSVKLDMTKMIQDKSNLRMYNEHVFRYNENSASEISNDLNKYVERYGNDDLNKVYINVGLFIQTIN